MISVSGCDAQADIVFVLDASGSIRYERFSMVTGYIKDVLSNMTMGRLHASYSFYLPRHMITKFSTGIDLDDI